uniref:hypothetical protein n=1 Tax=Flavobacterium sp. TaxID=239 RepID=UPI0040497790
MQEFIFNKFNSNKYLDLINKSSLDVDTYYLPAYLNFDAKIQGGEYEIFVLVEDNNYFIYPYIKIPLNEYKMGKYFDLASPYGYGGPISNNRDFFQRAEHYFINYISKFCVTEFVRYNWRYDFKFEVNIENLQNRKIVIVNLQNGFETVWNTSFSSKNRNLVNKMIKDGFEFIISKSVSDLNLFIDMYYDTMNNVSADNFYFFDRASIIELYGELHEKVILAKVIKDDTLCGAALFFISDTGSIYFLSARDILLSKFPITNFLISKVIEKLISLNIKILNLGGGLSNNDDDSLFKFKKNFSNTCSDFWVGKRIHNKEIYNDLINLWIKDKGLDDYSSKKHLLQFYRV